MRQSVLYDSTSDQLHSRNKLNQTGAEPEGLPANPAPERKGSSSKLGAWVRTYSNLIPRTTWSENHFMTKTKPPERVMSLTHSFTLGCQTSIPIQRNRIREYAPIFKPIQEHSIDSIVCRPESAIIKHQICDNRIEYSRCPRAMHKNE